MNNKQRARVAHNTTHTKKNILSHTRSPSSRRTTIALCSFGAVFGRAVSRCVFNLIEHKCVRFSRNLTRALVRPVQRGALLGLVYSSSVVVVVVVGEGVGDGGGGVPSSGILHCEQIYVSGIRARARFSQRRVRNCFLNNSRTVHDCAHARAAYNVRINYGCAPKRLCKSAQRISVHTTQPTPHSVSEQQHISSLSTCIHKLRGDLLRADDKPARE